MFVIEGAISEVGANAIAATDAADSVVALKEVGSLVELEIASKCNWHELGEKRKKRRR